MKRQPNPRLYMGLAVLTLVAGSAASYFQFGQFMDQAQVVAKLRVDTRPEDQIRKDLEDSETQLTECVAQLTHLEAGVPAFAYVPTMLAELEKLGTDTGIQVLGVRPIAAQVSKDLKKKRSAYQALDIEVKGRGDYGAVMKFVEALKTFPKIVEARMVNLTPKNEEGQVGAPKLDVEIQLRTYVFPQAQETARKGSPAGEEVASNG